MILISPVVEHVLLGHCRLSIIDLNGGKQPFKYTYNDIEYTIVYNGEIYNMNTIKEQLIDEGYHFTSQSDTEVVVASFIAYGPRCLNLFDGIFSFVISYKNKLLWLVINLCQTAFIIIKKMIYLFLVVK